MQFQVPQFIEVEDKIFGPLTFKQFIYLIGGGGASYLLWRLLPLFIGLPLVLIVGGFAVALAFLQLNGRPFILAVENGFFFLIHSKLYLWSNEKKPQVPRNTITRSNAVGGRDVYVPKLSDSRLHELAWSLDIKERIAAGTTSDSDRPHTDAVAPIRTARDAVAR